MYACPYGKQLHHLQGNRRQYYTVKEGNVIFLFTLYKKESGRKRRVERKGGEEEIKITAYKNILLEREREV